MLKKVLVALALTAVGAMLLTTTAVASDNRVAICHFSDDNPDAPWELLLISTNGKALESHLRHGDVFPGDTVPDMEGYLDENCHRIFAVAYTDIVDDGGGYDPDVDVLIAMLVDDGDGQLGAGDTVITNMYPTSFDPPFAFGRFTTTSHTVTSVGFASPSPAQIQVLSDDGLFEFFAESPDGFGGTTVWHRYYEEGLTFPTGFEFSWVEDFPNFYTPYGIFDPYLNLWVNPESPSVPESTVDHLYTMAGFDDMPFIDVEIWLP